MITGWHAGKEEPPRLFLSALNYQTYRLDALCLAVIVTHEHVFCFPVQAVT